mmetsp:Transcript_2904/g.8406  ORF Transcript_2904/g.8406 Transcript_2904/m.8406 type:complete len:235 (-) Transcript_2904:783-1487(-)
MAHEEPLAATVHPPGLAVLGADHSARKVVEGRRASGARIKRCGAPRGPHPREVRLHELGLEELGRVAHETMLGLLEGLLRLALSGDRLGEELLQFILPARLDHAQLARSPWRALASALLRHAEVHGLDLIGGAEDLDEVCVGDVGLRGDRPHEEEYVRRAEVGHLQPVKGAVHLCEGEDAVLVGVKLGEGVMQEEAAPLDGGTHPHRLRTLFEHAPLVLKGEEFGQGRLLPALG